MSIYGDAHLIHSREVNIENLPLNLASFPVADKCLCPSSSNEHPRALSFVIFPLATELLLGPLTFDHNPVAVFLALALVGFQRRNVTVGAWPWQRARVKG